MKVRIKECIVCEGRYDKNAIAQVADTVIIETRGFAVFSDRQLAGYLRMLAEKRGIVVMTDSDAAGFMIRNHIKGLIEPSLLKHAYIPDIPGKERRKRVRSAEGKLGVEGMRPEVILAALRQAGATFLDGETEEKRGEHITLYDLYEAGLSGGEDSSARRIALLKHLELPERLNKNALCDILSTLFTKQDFFALCERLFS